MKKVYTNLKTEVNKMFELADNEKIGIYLKEKIGEKFKKQRHFCKRYLEC